MREVSWHCAWRNRNDMGLCRIAGWNVAEKHFGRARQEHRRLRNRKADGNNEEEEKDSLHA
jgi:hypothetical protein